MKKFVFILVGLALISCSNDEAVAPVKKKSVVTEIKTPDGQYNFSYDPSGNFVKSNYVEGVESFEYKMSWNSDSTVLTKTQFHVNANTQTGVSIFKFNSDSTLAEFIHEVFNEYKAVYSFSYTGVKLSAMAISENDGETDNIIVEWTNDTNLRLTYKDGRATSFSYVRTDSPFLTSGSPEVVATLMDLDLPIFHMLSQQELRSIDDSIDDISVNEMTYTVQNGELKSFTKDGDIFNFIYTDITIN